MRKYIYSCIAMMLMLAPQASAQDSTYANNVAKYVAKYKNLAIAEQQRSGVPAAITLGQGILETEAGCSVLVTGANNHFGIKCRKDWKGETFAHTDDAPNECFRKYKCADDSYKDHSDYLKNSPRYASLFTLSKTDYPSWALGLKRCGYATNPHYAQQLIKIIEDFKLQEYTYAAMNSDLISQAEKKEILDDTDTDDEETTDPNKTEIINDKANDVAMSPVLPQAPLSKISASEKGGIINMNGLKAIYGYKGDMLLQYAIKYKMRYAHLLEINDLPDAPLASNMYIYLERKNTKGTHETHIVKPGESLIQIAQLEGIQLRRLMVLNRLNIGEEPIVGTVLQLQQFADAKPLLASKQAATKPLSKIVVRNSDDFIATNKQPAETVNSTPYTERREQAMVASTTAPAALVASIAKKPEMEAAKPAVVTDMQVAETASVNDDKKNAESKPMVPAPVQTEARVQAVSAPTPVVPISDDSKIIENKPTPITPPAQNIATTQKVISAPENDTKKVAEAKPAPMAAPVQNTAPAQAAAEPMDDLARLKAQLDKVVYTGNEKPAALPATAPVRQSNTAPVKATASDDKYYTVKKGDTAFNIAKQHNITMHQLMDWNDLNFDEIKMGQRLRVKE